MTTILHNLPPLPRDVTLEKIVLGTLMSENSEITKRIKSILQAEHFYKASHQHIAMAIAELDQLGNSIDIKIVGITLKQRGKLEMIGGYYELSDILSSAANSATNLEIYYRHLIELWMRRELIMLAQNIIGSASDEAVDVFNIVDSTYTSIQKINPYTEENN